MYRPWIFLITDGQPTDMHPGDARFEEIRRSIHEAEMGKRCSFFAIGVDGADMGLRAQLAPSARPPLKLRGHSFKAFFQWLSAAAPIRFVYDWSSWSVRVMGCGLENQTVWAPHSESENPSRLP